MSAAVAFADLGDFRATSFPNLNRLEADQFHFEPEISPEHIRGSDAKADYVHLNTGNGEINELCVARQYP